MQKASVLLLALVWATAGLGAQLTSNAKKPLACVPFEEFRIAELTFSHDLSDVREMFGKPASVRSFEGVDDGGAFTYREELFPGMAVTFGRNDSVDGIKVTSAEYALPSGVKVGMEFDDVAETLRFSGVGIRRIGTVRLAPCRSFEEAWLELTFDLDEPGSPFARSLLRQIVLWISYD